MLLFWFKKLGNFSLKQETLKYREKKIGTHTISRVQSINVHLWATCYIILPYPLLKIFILREFRDYEVLQPMGLILVSTYMFNKVPPCWKQSILKNEFILISKLILNTYSKIVSKAAIVRNSWKYIFLNFSIDKYNGKFSQNA